MEKNHLSKRPLRNIIFRGLITENGYFSSEGHLETAQQQREILGYYWHSSVFRQLEWSDGFKVNSLKTEGLSIGSLKGN